MPSWYDERRTPDPDPERNWMAWLYVGAYMLALAACCAMAAAPPRWPW